MPDPVSSIRNLGPASEASFARAGLHSADQVRALGPDESYRRLIAAGTRPHFIGYYALVMGLQGRLWNDCTPEEKRALRVRFDALKQRGNADGTPPALAAALDALGVVAAGPRRG
ncbi:MAG: TfoX/Sxy family DNA transformation protein [Paracoccaceae bacterium]